MKLPDAQRLVPTCKVTKKFFHASFFMHFALIFSEYIELLLQERL